MSTSSTLRIFNMRSRHYIWFSSTIKYATLQSAGLLSEQQHRHSIMSVRCKSSVTQTSSHNISTSRKDYSNSNNRKNNRGAWSLEHQKRHNQSNSFPRPRPRRHSSLIYLPQKVPIRCPTGDEIDSFELLAQDFAISKPKRIGGHALLGRNGSGKSLLVEYLTHPELFVDADSHHDWNLLHPDDIAYVSFRSHVDMLRDDPHRSVHNVITDGAGNLSRAAQYMVVRFGLFPLLYRTLSTLSTGEVRKTLLVSALCQDPKLLILENAFDGLDVKSRQELKAIVSKTIQGLENSGKLLIQQVQASNVNPTQVLLSTHRPEEIVDEISTVTMTLEDDTRTNRYNMVTIQRPRDYSQERLMYTALGLDKDYSISKKFSQVAPLEDIDPSLPSLEEIQSVWTANRDVTPATLISLNNVEIRRHRDGASIKDEGDATLLHALTWKIERGQRWLIAGGNGAGKSTLSRFLLQDENPRKEEVVDNDDCIHGLISGDYQKSPATQIGWVSTESHLEMVTSKQTTWDIITNCGDVPLDIAEKITQWVLGDAFELESLKNRRLDELSQGEQKLILMASALAQCPNVLILDEPTQGLDWATRRRILALLERVCQVFPDELSLIFITHYEDEWIPSLSHVLHLDRGHAVYQGSKSNYDPLKVSKSR